MPRVATSAELMDRIYAHQRHVYDLTRKYYLLGRDRLIDNLAPEAGARVLEIGCGTGRNLIRAAQKYPQALFYGIDVSTQMLATAADSVARAGLSAQVRLAYADATALDPAALFGQARFERVFASYTLSMIPDWRAALEASIRLMAPGGQLHVVDFGRQHGLPDWFRSGLRWWLTQFHVTPRDDLEVTMGRLAGRNCARLAVERPYRGYAHYLVLRLPNPVGMPADVV
jgi:S-adenosylmethionine-diacylgycerolhomoserine-N-methlytransferase